MTSYQGRHAELYDILYADKPYAAEAAFVHECFQRHGIPQGSRLLELACGTGQHAFEFERLGYEVTATDSSAAMLGQARRKAQKQGSTVEFEQQDMRSLDVSGRPFDAAVCLFDSIGFVQTNDALRQVLSEVYRHLRPYGLFLFEFWHAAAMVRSFEPTRVRRWSLPDGELLRISETALDCARQLAKVSYTILELRRDGTFTSFREEQINRYFLVQEMAAWSEACGFEPQAWLGGFSFGAKIDLDTWHVVAVLRRKAEPAE